MYNDESLSLCWGIEDFLYDRQQSEVVVLGFEMLFVGGCGYTGDRNLKTTGLPLSTHPVGLEPCFFG